MCTAACVSNGALSSPGGGWQILAHKSQGGAYRPRSLVPRMMQRRRLQTFRPAASFLARGAASTAAMFSYRANPSQLLAQQGHVRSIADRTIQRRLLAPYMLCHGGAGPCQLFVHSAQQPLPACSAVNFCMRFALCSP